MLSPADRNISISEMYSFKILDNMQVQKLSNLSVEDHMDVYHNKEGMNQESKTFSGV
jgi:hypothetical protein